MRGGIGFFEILSGGPHAPLSLPYLQQYLDDASL